MRQFESNSNLDVRFLNSGDLIKFVRSSPCVSDSLIGITSTDGRRAPSLHLAKARPDTVEMKGVKINESGWNTPVRLTVSKSTAARIEEIMADAQKGQ